VEKLHLYSSLEKKRVKCGPENERETTPNVFIKADAQSISPRDASINFLDGINSQLCRCGLRAAFIYIDGQKRFSKAFFHPLDRISTFLFSFFLSSFIVFSGGGGSW